MYADCLILWPVQLGQPDKGECPRSGQSAGEGVGHWAGVVVAAGSAQHHSAGIGHCASASDGLPRRQPHHVCSSL